VATLDNHRIPEGESQLHPCVAELAPYRCRPTRKFEVIIPNAERKRCPTDLDDFITHIAWWIRGGSPIRDG